jgi:hypothetical protein
MRTLDAKVSYGAFKFGVPEEELNGAEVLRYRLHECPLRLGSVSSLIEEATSGCSMPPPSAIRDIADVEHSPAECRLWPKCARRLYGGFQIEPVLPMTTLRGGQVTAVGPDSDRWRTAVRLFLPLDLSLLRHLQRIVRR